MKLSVDEYGPWLEKETEKLVRPALSKGRKLLEEGRATIGEAERFFGDLSRKADRDMTTKKDPVSYRAARAIGRSAEDASESLARLQIPSEVSWESLKGFKDALSMATRTLRDSRNRASGELSGLYILDMRSFGGYVDRVSRSSEKLGQFLEEDGLALQKARTLEGTLMSITTMEREFLDLHKQTQNLVQESKLFDEEIRKLEAEHEEISKRSPLREILDAERALRIESKEFRTRTLAHLKRPLRKLRDMSARGELPLSVDERSALERYIDSPYRSFLSKDSGPFIKSILASVKSAVQSGKMGFKSRKAARVNAQLDQILDGTSLSDQQARGRELLSQRRKNLKDPSGQQLYQSRKVLLIRLEEGGRQRDELLSRIGSLEEKSKTFGKRLDELLRSAEERTQEYTGQRVQINLGKPADSARSL